ncbi:gamma-glutamylcyclotransferase family protein [Thermocoleostomius sinensis]|uniref:Gamma-glutamylcyclotransferase n=1 Tax=Thermocoleostomius sinensis A174 TaxID=2016057 RepID=A0A9E8ZKL6_9CYAN|nr:gamma-glutamylcyclotransferase [Thermocoleostomius sinensis]WAL60221.1 gamma-glutamylcyclotransferase [Thermocoleostomius sinensis A174]
MDLGSTVAPARLKVFVYGTLKPGQCNYDRYCGHAVVNQQVAIVYGQLFDLPFGYPALTPGPGVVHGVVLEFADNNVLTQLDELEDYDPQRPIGQNEYVRVLVKTFSLQHQPLGEAWAYQMPLEQAKRFGGVRLPHGYWQGR